MNLEYKHLLPANFSPNSRVWIYQSNRLFTMGEVLETEDLVNQFCGQWLSHGAEVTAWGRLFFGQFLILISDETDVTVSGCSTDSSVRFVKSLEQKFHVDFFDRSNLAFVVKDKVQLLPLSQTQYAMDNGFITQDTLYFNNTVHTLRELQNNWIIPVKDSWLSKKLKAASNP